MDERFSQTSASLTDYPNLGRLGRVAGTREAVVHENYILVYNVVGDCVRVLRILHVARQWPPTR